MLRLLIAFWNGEETDDEQNAAPDKFPSTVNTTHLAVNKEMLSGGAGLCVNWGKKKEERREEGKKSETKTCSKQKNLKLLCPWIPCTGVRTPICFVCFTLKTGVILSALIPAQLQTIWPALIRAEQPLRLAKDNQNLAFTGRFFILRTTSSMSKSKEGLKNKKTISFLLDSRHLSISYVRWAKAAAFYSAQTKDLPALQVLWLFYFKGKYNLLLK